MLLDIHMRSHVERLFGSIWDQIAITYLKPFETAKMDIMASAFGSSLEALEEGLSRLISNGKIPFRLDLCNQVCLIHLIPRITPHLVTPMTETKTKR